MDNDPTPSKRIAYLDVAKGIGILLVILGPNYIKALLPGMGKFISSFHMPLFFMAAICVPVLVYQLFLKEDPRLAGWFGLKRGG